MIIYKLNEINERIEEMRSNINNIKKKAEDEIQADIQIYRSECNNIKYSNDFSESGKEKQLNILSQKYYDKYVKKGAELSKQIEAEYNKAIDRVKELKQFDDERKIVDTSKADAAEILKQNTNLVYAIEVLKNIDEKSNHAELTRLFDSSQGSEKILNLIKLKGNDLQSVGVEDESINKMMYTLKSFDTDYAEKLNNEKLNSIDYCKNVEYPRVITKMSLKDVFEVDKNNLSQFSAN